ncbi:hypothetical protein EJB05_30852, partial [Eragrostis curvula]
MARSFTGALIATLLLLTVHLLAGQAFARHAPAGLRSAPGVRVLYTAPTTPGPSPSNGHGNQPSAGEALDDDVLNGARGGVTATENHTVFCPSPCHYPTTAGEKPHNQLNVTGHREVAVN